MAPCAEYVVVEHINVQCVARHGGIVPEAGDLTEWSTAVTLRQRELDRTALIVGYDVERVPADIDADDGRWVRAVDQIPTVRAISMPSCR